MPLDVVGQWYYDDGMKAPTAMLSVRLPKKLILTIDRRAARERKTRTEVIRYLLAYGMRETPSVEAVLGKVLNQVTALRHAVERLEKARR